MSRERLEDKLVKFRQHLALGYVNMDILNQAHEIHELVMEQAERVQELEELIAAYHTELSIKDNANKRIKKKNKRYREAIHKGINATRYTNSEVAYMLSEALDERSNR